jgi:hypothetical protein
MNEIYALVSKPAFQFGFACAVVALFLLIVWLFIRVRRLSGTYLSLTAGLEKRSLESVLRVYMKSLQETAERVELLERLAQEIQDRLSFSVRCVGLVCFDAFDDVGGKLSFALALLDDHRNGVVISHLYGRHESTTYIKEVTNGVATRQLTREEERAIASAAPGGAGRERAAAS